MKARQYVSPLHSLSEQRSGLFGATCAGCQESDSSVSSLERHHSSLAAETALQGSFEYGSEQSITGRAQRGAVHHEDQCTAPSLHAERSQPHECEVPSEMIDETFNRCGFRRSPQQIPPSGDPPRSRAFVRSL